MPVLVVTMDLSELIKDRADLAEEITKRAEEAAEKLSAMTHAHILELADQKLQSRKEAYIKALRLEQLGDGMWTITVPKEAMWIEEGIKSGFDMLPGLLKSPKAKMGKNGRYLIVPFKHSKESSNQTQAEKILAHTIKSEMAQRGITNEIERDRNGAPKLGLLHKFNIDKPAQQHQIVPPHQGPQGRPWQVHSRPSGQEGPGGRPYLYGVRIYQRSVKNDKGEQSVKKDIMTFRTASEGQQGKWIHPGLEPMNFLDQAQVWAEEQWTEKIFPEIIESLDL